MGSSLSCNFKKKRLDEVFRPFLKKSFMPPLTLTEPPPGMIICCTLRDVLMNSKLQLAPEKDFFPKSFNALRKLTANDKNLEIFSIEKRKNDFYSFFFYNKDLKYYFKIE